MKVHHSLLDVDFSSLTGGVVRTKRKSSDIDLFSVFKTAAYRTFLWSFKLLSSLLSVFFPGPSHTV